MLPSTPPARWRRAAFTLIELLVVIAIIAVLIGLLLPAVQKVREASARSQCQNNLKQLGIAVHNYHGVHALFPASISYASEAAPGTQAGNLTGEGWILRSLPFMEQENLYKQFTPFLTGNFALATGRGIGDPNPACRAAMATVLSVLTCKSDPNGGVVFTKQFQWDPTPTAPTSYKGVLGTGRMGGAGTGTPDCHNTVGCNGIFWRNAYQEKLRFDSVTDGLSNTLLIGEDMWTQNYHSAAYYANGDYAACHIPLNTFQTNPGNWPTAISFRSSHSGGVNFALADGSVRFVSDQIQFSLFQAACTRNGTEPLALP